MKTLRKKNRLFRKTKKRINKKELLDIEQVGKGKSTNGMSCSPLVEGKRVSKETCYTPSVILKIRDEYNKKHGISERINTSNPTEIWKQLKNRLTTCKKEDCWLKEISDDNLRKEIDTYIFAPDSPPEWKSNPNEWLSNIDIDTVMKQYEKKYPYFKFIKSSPIDFDERPESMGKSCVSRELCEFSLKKTLEKGIRKVGMVFNLDKHDEDGSHWVSMFLDVPSRFIFYFDSNGIEIPEEIKELKDRIIREAKELMPRIQLKYFSTNEEHQQHNTECGMYSLFFILTMLTGKVLNKKLRIRDKIELFKNNAIPDEYVEKYRKVYFNESDT